MLLKVFLSTMVGLAVAAPRALQERQATSSGTSTASIGTTTASASSTCTPCSGNTASTRDQWCDNTIDDDYYSVVPCTGNTREYWFELTETTGSPDGVERMLQTINGISTFFLSSRTSSNFWISEMRPLGLCWNQRRLGTVPGPTIFADWYVYAFPDIVFILLIIS